MMQLLSASYLFLIWIYNVLFMLMRSLRFVCNGEAAIGKAFVEETGLAVNFSKFKEYFCNGTDSAKIFATLIRRYSTNHARETGTYREQPHAGKKREKERSDCRGERSWREFALPHIPPTTARASQNEPKNQQWKSNVITFPIINIHRYFIWCLIHSEKGRAWRTRSR